MNLKHQSRILVLAVTSTVALSACHMGSPESRVAKAREDLAKHDTKTALIELKSALQEKPDLPEGRYLLGRAYLEEGDPRSAEFELRKAQALHYDADKVGPSLGQALLAEGETQKLIDEAPKMGVVASSAKAELTSLVGMAQLQNNRPDDAESSFQAASAFDSTNALATLGKARIEIVHGHPDKATPLIQAVIQQDPQLGEAYLVQGDLHRSQGDMVHAADAYEQAVQREPNSFAARFLAATTELGLHQTDRATPNVKALSRLAPRHPGSGYADGLLAYEQRDYGRAEDAIQRSLASAPDSRPSLLLAATNEMMLKQPSQAISHLQQVLDHTPADLQARTLLAKVYLQEQQPGKAQEALAPALVRAPNDPQLLALAGEVATSSGDFTNAKRLMDQARAAGANTSATARPVNVSATEAVGLPASGASTSDSPPTELLSVASALRQKKYDEARKQADSYLSAHPDNAVALNLKAAVLQAQGDRPGARELLSRAIKSTPKYYPAVANLAAMDIAEGHYAAAEDRYRGYLAIDHQYLPAQMAMTRLEAARGVAPSKVAEELTAMVHQHPESPLPAAALAELDAATGDGKSAIAMADQALKLAPHNGDLIDLAGRIHLQFGEALPAIDLYQRWSEESPHQLAPLVRLAEAQLTAGQREAAIQTAGRIVHQQSNGLEQRVNAAEIYAKAGHETDALAMATSIEKAGPSSPIGFQVEGDVRMQTRDYAKAADAYAHAMTLGSSSDLLIKQHDALMLANKRPQAQEILTAWLDKHPEDLNVRAYDAETALKLHDYARAEAQYKVMEKTDPSNVRVLNNLAWAAMGAHDPNAGSYADRALALAPANPVVMDTAGWLLVERNERSRGIDLLERASAQAPGNLDIRLHLAKALVKDGRTQEARAQLKSITDKGPGTAAAQESSSMLSKLG